MAVGLSGEVNKMNYIETHGLKLSKFQLGTVQLGMTYGLGEDRAKPSEEKAMGILDEAVALGINNIDTANNYGDSQELIGKWLAKRKNSTADAPFVVTKIGPLKHGSYDILRDDVMYQTEECMRQLGTQKLDCLMLHNFEDYEQDSSALQKIFEELKRNGAYRISAISAYSHNDYGMIAGSGFDAVQIPLNVFDRVQTESGGIQKIADAGMIIFARSVFLQGLVFHKPKNLDPRMSFCEPYLKKYHELCEEFSLAPDVLALSHVLSLPGVACAVIGCDNVNQLRANCNLFDKTVVLTEQQKDKLRDAFLNVDGRVINPGLWFR